MTQSILSTKFQLVIPKEIRQRFHLHSGQRMVFLVKGDVIALVPERPLSELRGMARGVKFGPVREKTERSL